MLLLLINAQVHGGMGVCQDTFLAAAYAHMRTLRIADGPDEVHMRSIARNELKRPLKDRAGRLNHVLTPQARL
jgi:alkylation response protein AidB-like acyl-CoA dehydrogenase